MKVITSADWHIGTFKGPEQNGVNLRFLDTINCLDFMIKKAEEEHPELFLVSGDIFNTGKTWSERCCDEVITAIDVISRLARFSKHVVIMRGTPNHDGIGQFKVLQAHFSEFNNVHIVTTPDVINTEYADIAVLPGFDSGEFRGKYPGLSKEEENEVFTKELGNIVMGLKAQCDTEKPAILMAHYTVPGCNTESGQSQFLTQFEPVLTVECLTAANYDLVALGHIHRPQLVPGYNNVYYSGAINSMNFNDEGQERGFWLHEEAPINDNGFESHFIQTPYREFVTLEWDSEAVEKANTQLELLPEELKGRVTDKIVRIRYCCTMEQKKALNDPAIRNALYEAGAFYVADIEMVQNIDVTNKIEFYKETEPEENLKQYLEEKCIPEEEQLRIKEKAIVIMQEAIANSSLSASQGIFEPIDIEVKNYRNYVEESFNFSDIRFCTINGSNGAGKSSLFMDAIIDCLYEEPREGELTGWIRNDESARSGSISFTFRIGEKIFRVVRTRTRSGKATLNLSEFIDEEWENRSKEKIKDTQEVIVNILGMDSMTFKSCALIMQDQYGLFLQAKKEERMVILANLLGLGIYGDMENMAKDKMKVLGSQARTLKGTVDVHLKTIRDYGNPFEDLKREEAILKDYELNLNKVTMEKDSKALIWSTQKEALERRNKLLSEITTLEEKKAIAEQNRSYQETIISQNKAVLEEEQAITTNVKRYHEIVEQDKIFSEEATLYSAKIVELTGVNSEVQNEELALIQLTEKLKKKQSELSSLNGQVDEESIKEAVKKYEAKKKQLEELHEQQTKYFEACKKKDQTAYVVDSKRAYIKQEIQKLASEKANLQKKANLLKDSRCLNIEEANCKFLADAVQAKKELDGFDNKIIAFETEQKPLLEKLEQQLKEKRVAMNELQYDETAITKVNAEIGELAWAIEELEKLKERESKIAILSSDIHIFQSNLSDAEKRLTTLKSKVQSIEKEKEKYQKSFMQHQQILKEIESLKDWITKEKEIPVAKEKQKNATTRYDELSLEIESISKEITDKKLDSDKELLATESIEVIETQVKNLDNEIKQINTAVKQFQMNIGAINQKIDETKKLGVEIKTLQKQITNLSIKISDYELLKNAFSQDGIPHQIIRAVIPQLTATANSILGQMTEGKMGVEFQLERTPKSNTKKEMATLDVFIEEYGKGILPYLSKSGGEKVKASLSVILALAELKSASVGIQLGMLFIDEPPFLDVDGISAYCDALEIIQNRYENIKIMAITHDPTMKTRFPQSLDVIKTEQGSKIIYE